MSSPYRQPAPSPVQPALPPMFDREIEDADLAEDAVVARVPVETPALERQLQNEQKTLPLNWRAETVVKIAAGVGLVLAVGGAALLWPGPRGAYEVSAHLPDVTNITPGSGVSMSGRHVGEVQSLALEDGAARIDIAMLPGVILYEDATVGKRVGCDPGEDCVVLSQGTTGGRVIRAGGYIKYFADRP